MNKKSFGLFLLICVLSVSLFGGSGTGGGAQEAPADGSKADLLAADVKRLHATINAMRKKDAKREKRERYYAAGAFAGGNKGSRFWDRKVGAIISEKMWEQLETPRDAGGLGLMDAANFQKKDSDGNIKRKDGIPETDLVGGMLPLFGWAVATSTISGVADSIADTAKSASSLLLNKSLSYMGNKWNNFWNWIVYDGAVRVRITDIGRWKGWIAQMIKVLKEISHKSQRTGEVGQRLQMRQFQNQGKDGAADENKIAGEEKQEVDICWLENKRIYLGQLLQIGAQIENRKRFYEKKAEIVSCLNALSAALLGYPEDMKRDEKGNVRAAGGGLYALVDNVQTLADFASPEIERALELFYGNIQGLLSELTAWVDIESNDKAAASKSLFGDSRLSAYN